MTKVSNFVILSSFPRSPSGGVMRLMLGRITRIVTGVYVHQIGGRSDPRPVQGAGCGSDAPARNPAKGRSARRVACWLRERPRGPPAMSLHDPEEHHDVVDARQASPDEPRGGARTAIRWREW